MGIFRIAIITLVFPIVVLAQQNNFGDSPYAIQHAKWNCPAFKARFSSLGRRGISFLWNTFGNKNECLSSELRDSRLDFIEGIVANETCVSRGDCGAYEVLHGYSTGSLSAAIAKGDPQVKSRYQNAARSLCQYVAGSLNHNARKVLNPSLETHLSRQNFATVANWVHEVCPDWEIVWNPVGANPGLPQAPASLSEGHGDSPHFSNNACIANPDGAVLNSDQWEPFFRKYANCAQVFAWTLNDNCAALGQPKMDPRARPCKVTDNYKPIQAAAKAITQPPIPVPAWSDADNKSLLACNKILPNPDGVKHGFLWKESETKHTPNGGLAALSLLPNNVGLDSSTKNVSVLKEGLTIDNLTFVYLYTADKSNRPVWLSHKTPASFPFNVVLKGKGPKGTFCWKIPNPHIRND